MPEQQAEYLTVEKHKELVKELDHLKNVKRREVAESLEYAKSLGDLAENAEYHEARDLQANIEDRITKLEEIMKEAIIVDESKHATDSVNIGSTVKVKKSEGTNSITYKVVGSEESDMSLGYISIRSPFGIAIFGKKKGEEFVVKTPTGDVTYTIVDIK